MKSHLIKGVAFGLVVSVGAFGYLSARGDAAYTRARQRERLPFSNEYGPSVDYASAYAQWTLATTALIQGPVVGAGCVLTYYAAKNGVRVIRDAPRPVKQGLFTVTAIALAYSGARVFGRVSVTVE